ncbi:MAG: thioredoxin TrxC [Halocynthiibacter sp.]
MSHPKKLTCLSCGQLNRVPEERLSEFPKCGSCSKGLMTGKPVDVTPQILDKATRHDDVPLVVDFWAPWCGPCRQMAPEFAKSAGQLRNNVRFVKVNTEAFPQAGSRHNVRGIPTMAYFFDGKERKRKSGALPSSAITAWAKP